MPIRMPPLNALRVFEAAARHLSFKMAADELFVTPAAVSHQIAQLEEFLGVPLFKRMHRGVALTPAAQACYRSLNEGFEAIRSAVGQLSVKPVAPLTVSCPPSFAHRWLLPRLYGFVSEHPEVDIQVTTKLDIRPDGRRASASMALAMMEAAESYDLVIALGREDQYPMPARKLLPLSVTPLCAPALAARIAEQGLDALADLPILHDGRGTFYLETDFWTMWLDAAGLDPAIAARGQRFTLSFLSLDAAMAGQGVVVSTPALAKADIDAGRLVRPFDLEVPIAQAYHMVAQDAAAPRVRAFTDWLTAQAAASLSAAA